MLIDLTVAIQIGMVLAAFLFIQRMADVTQVGFIRHTLTLSGVQAQPLVTMQQSGFLR